MENQKFFDDKIPEDQIKSRKAPDGYKLDYVEVHYILDRLNQVVGHLNWTYQIVELKPLTEDNLSYSCRALIGIVTTNGTVYREGVGIGEDKTMEMALKKAESDAIKRAAMKFGRSFGLELYFKDEKKEKSTETEKSPVKVSSKPKEAKPIHAVSSQNTVTTKTYQTRDEAEMMFKNTVRVLEAKRKVTKDDVKAEFKKRFNAEKLADLDKGQLETLIAHYSPSLSN